jgi:hypothetical protein
MHEAKVKGVPYRWNIPFPRTERRHEGVSFRQQKRKRTAYLRERKSLEKASAAAGLMSTTLNDTALVAAKFAKVLGGVQCTP